MTGERRPRWPRPAGRSAAGDGPGPRRRASPAERRTEKAAVDDPQVVFDAALRFLEVRVRSVAEVRRRLTGAGYSAELVMAAIERLDRLGILDDAAFARAWVASRDRAHPRGEIALRRELAQKGVARDVTEEILAERRSAAGAEVAGSDPGTAPASSPDSLAAARLLARHARSLERIADPGARRQRAYALLARHGFDSETAGHESARALQAARDGDADPDS